MGGVGEMRTIGTDGIAEVFAKSYALRYFLHEV